MKAKIAKPSRNGEEITDSELFSTLLNVRNGNFKVRFPADQIGIKGKICDTLNEIVEMNEKMVYEFEKVGSSIGKQGKLNQRVEIEGARGSWGSCVDSCEHADFRFGASNYSDRTRYNLGGKG